MMAQRYGRLIILGEGTPTEAGYPRLRCKCDCGKITEVKTSNLLSGHTKSCGCFGDERRVQANLHPTRWFTEGDLSGARLPGGEVVVIDTESLPSVEGHAWHLTGKKGEAQTVVRVIGRPPSSSSRTMAQDIMNPPEGFVVISLDKDPLNLRKSNLRIASPTEKQAYQAKTLGKTSSIYKGVCWSKAQGKWMAKLGNGSGCFLGYYTSEIAAAEKYDQEARKRWGEFALTNADMVDRGLIQPRGHMKEGPR